MLAYYVVYADRAIGGLCEYYEVGEADGVRAVNVLSLKYGRTEMITATTGRWTFYSGAHALCAINLDSQSLMRVDGDRSLRPSRGWEV